MVQILKVIAVNEGAYLLLSDPGRWGVSNRGDGTGFFKKEFKTNKILMCYVNK